MLRKQRLLSQIHASVHEDDDIVHVFGSYSHFSQCFMVFSTSFVTMSSSKPTGVGRVNNLYQEPFLKITIAHSLKITIARKKSNAILKLKAKTIDGLVQKTIGVLCWISRIISSLVDDY